MNPIGITRDAWWDLAAGADVRCIEVEVVCSDFAEHRRRVGTRVVDVPNLVSPTRAEVVGREWDEWTRPRLVIDTAGRPIEACAADVLAQLE